MNVNGVISIKDLENLENYMDQLHMNAHYLIYCNPKNLELLEDRFKHIVFLADNMIEENKIVLLPSSEQVVSMIRQELKIVEFIEIGRDTNENKSAKELYYRWRDQSV